MLTEGSGKLNSKCEYIYFHTGQIVFFFLCAKVERENLSDIYDIPVFDGSQASPRGGAEADFVEPFQSIYTES